MSDTCSMRIYAGTQETPPEWCDNDVYLDTEFCLEHQEPEWDDSDDDNDWYFQ